MRSYALLSAFGIIASPVLAQFAPLPAPTLNQRVAPRAAWTAVTSAGLTATGSTFRCDNMGAASQSKMYVFGGCLDNNTANTKNDLYEFDPIAGTFTMINDGATGPAPHARGRASVAWNPLSQRLVVYGGDNRNTGPLPINTYLGDIWEYDPATNAWTDVTPASGPAPAPRRWASMAFEPNLGGMLMFGGDTGAGALQVNNETWLFLGGQWIPFSPANVPPARRMASLMTRPDFNDVIMVGGDDSSLLNGFTEPYRHLDVWTWNGGDWARISNYDWATSTGTFPASAFANQAVYDPLRKRVVMQGGQGIAANTATNVNYVFGTTVYNGSPTNYTSEFDCLTNTWHIYGNPTTGTTPYNNNDPVLGRISRFFAAYIPATGKIYKSGGQNPAASGSRPAYNVYAYAPTTAAAATTLGAGCNGLALTNDQLPWTSRTVTATATGFGPASFGFGVIGFGTQSTPLSLLHPAGQPGCDLLVSTDVTNLLLPVGGSATMTVSLPADPAFAGLALNLQAVELELSGGGIAAIRSTNGLSLTIGAL
ncbi:MAG: hypothetical protein RL398_893 [Planctomycetota bacterium]